MDLQSGYTVHGLAEWIHSTRTVRTVAVHGLYICYLLGDLLPDLVLHVEDNKHGLSNLTLVLMFHHFIIMCIVYGEGNLPLPHNYFIIQTLMCVGTGNSPLPVPNLETY